MTPEFRFGEIVHLRHFQHQTISAVHPLRTVRHDARGLLLWGDQGTRYWHLNLADGRTLGQAPLPEWVAAPKVPVARTTRHAMLSWHPVGASYSIRFFFRDGSFTNWYANLEVPAVAWRDGTLAGLDTVDWDLDVWIDADRRWRWKDEEEFVERLRWPEHYWVEDADRVRGAGHEVVALVEAGLFPFDGTWCDFQPAPDWGPIVTDGPVPGWDRPRAC